MSKKFAACLLLFSCAVLGLSALTIKIGTVAPNDTPWTDILHRLAGQWETLSGGSIQVEIYAGGIAGGESDIIRKMRIGQLQGAALTELALGQIVPDILAIDFPFFISTDGEFNYVLRKSRSYFDQRFEEAGFRLLTWSSAGWARFFATKKIESPSDLKKLRLGVPAGDGQLLNTWRKLGFDAIPLPIPDILTGLQSGMIDAFYAPPDAAVVYQWFRGALNMSALRVAPVVIGLVIDNRTWEKIPADLRPQLEETMKGVQAELDRSSVTIDDQAIATMKQRGLTVNPISPQIEREWQQLGTVGSQMLVGNLVSQQIYDRIKGYLKDYKASSGD